MLAAKIDATKSLGTVPANVQVCVLGVVVPGTDTVTLNVLPDTKAVVPGTLEPVTLVWPAVPNV